MTSNPSQLTPHDPPDCQTSSAISGRISAVVPARDEEDVIARCVESLALQPEIGEIIVVDDGSTDATAAILKRLQEAMPRLRVVQTGGVPAGWVGKNNAAALGGRETHLPWLLFTDADSQHLPGSSAEGLRLASEHQAGLVSFSPEQEMRSWPEKALIPFIYTRLAARYPYEVVNDPQSPSAAASGAYFLVRRDAYDAVGGHASVAGEVLEDVALAERVKQAGFRLWFASGAGVVRVRMYRTFQAMWEGWKKNLFPLMGSSARAVRHELASVVPWVPCLLLLAGLRWPILAALGLVLLVGRLAAYAALLRRNGFPLSFLLYYVPGVSLYAAVLLASRRSYGRGRVKWKGREYSVAGPAAESAKH